MRILHGQLPSVASDRSRVAVVIGAVWKGAIVAFTGLVHDALAEDAAQDLEPEMS